MKYRSAAPVLLLPLTLALGCADRQSPLAPPAEARFAKGDAAMISHAPVLTFESMTEVGSSRLVRTTRGYSVNLSTTGLQAGHAVTLWAVIFNKPEQCAASPCMEPDIFNPMVMADVVYTAGHVVGGSGQATFAGHRNEGDASGSILPALGGMAIGLMDARTAEIHFVVRDHGPILPGMVDEMISTFGAGCNNAPAGTGTPGPNDCMDLQFAIHVAS